MSSHIAGNRGADGNAYRAAICLSAGNIYLQKLSWLPLKMGIAFFGYTCYNNMNTFVCPFADLSAAVS